MAQRTVFFAAVAFLWQPTPAHVNDASYVKYPLYDGYVRSCSQKEENFGFEETLEVRRYMPDIRSRDWARGDYQYRAGDGFQEATTSRVETRAYHSTDVKSVGEIATAKPNVEDTFTGTRGTETATYEYPHLTGPYHTNMDEGTLNPFDQSALSGWCGEDDAGDRVSFLLFDMQDFDAAALSKVVLRATPKHLPWKTTIEVRGACNATEHRNLDGSARRLASSRGTGSIDSDAPGAIRFNGDAYGDPVTAPGRAGHTPLWHEGSLMWSTAPFIGDDEPNKVVCEWSGSAEDVYHDQGPLECDVTILAQQATESSDRYLCLSLDMRHAPSNSREAASFYSRDDTSEGFSGRGEGSNGSERIAAEFTSSSREPGLRHDDAYAGIAGFRDGEQRREGGDRRRSNARTITRDPSIGDGGAVGGSTGGGGARPRRETLPGLEFGTVRRAPTDECANQYGGRFCGGSRSAHSGGREEAHEGRGGRGPKSLPVDDAVTRKPHLVIVGSRCGRFADHSALDPRCSAP